VKRYVYLVLAALALGAFGCSGARTILRGQDPEAGVDDVSPAQEQWGRKGSR
jgi:hypothetical protein